MPDVLNLSTGAPFQPFNRSPQIRYQYKANSRVQLTASVLWQLQYLSSGPKGMSEDYIKNSCIPEMFVGADFTPADGSRRSYDLLEAPYFHGMEGANF